MGNDLRFEIQCNMLLKSYFDSLTSAIRKEDLLAYSLLLVYYFVMIALAFIAKGTGDDGDSVFHFLFAKYAFASPENFVNHWAKPVYVLLSSVFAQFGFIGIKIFNVTVTTLAIFFTYRIAQQLRIQNSWFVVIILCCAPMYIRLSLSGLTEPLFALAFASVIFLAMRQKLFYSVLLASFLPFIRSEGLIILCVYFLFLLFKKEWKLIPVLATGHVIYSIIGWVFYKDFLWVFNRMTYATLNSAYGHGSPFTFIYGMVDFLGIPLLILFCLGTVSGIVCFFRDIFRSMKNFSAEELWLIYGGFFGVWFSHMIFWTFGLFNSLGLLRVLVAVIPCAGIICVRGFNVILGWKKVSSNVAAKAFITAILVIAVFEIPFLQLKWTCDFDLTGNQKAILRAADKYRDTLKGYTIYASSVYSAYAFHYNIFDSTQHRWMQDINDRKKIPAKSAIVWDDFYAPAESKIVLSNLLVDDRFELLDTFHARDCLGKLTTVAVLLSSGVSMRDWIVKDTVFKYDFETENFGGRESEHSFSGKYSSLVDEKNAFSPGFSVKVSQLGFSLPSTLRISAMFYAPVIPADQYKHAVFVASLVNNDSVFFWKALDIDNVLKVKNTWEKVSFNLKIPVAIDSSDILKIYIWNPHPVALYIDDMLVEQLKPKQK